MTKLQSDGLPKRLRQAMSDMDMTISELSRDANISRPMIYGLLDGVKHPTLPKVEALAGALGVRPAWLAFGALAFGAPEAPASSQAAPCAKEARKLGRQE